MQVRQAVGRDQIFHEINVGIGGSKGAHTGDKGKYADVSLIRYYAVDYQEQPRMRPPVELQIGFATDMIN